MSRRRTAIACCALAVLAACSNDEASPSSTAAPTAPPDTEVVTPDEQLTAIAPGGAFDLAWPGETCAEAPAGEVALLDPANGSVIWQTETPRSSSLRLVTDGSLVWHVTDTGDTTNGVVALDAATGAPVWQRQFAESLYEVQLSTSALIVGMARGMVSFDPVTGEELWRRTATAGRGFAVGQVDDVFGPLPLTDTVYVNDGGTVFALDAATGEERWRKTTSEDWSYAPGLHDGSLWHVDYNGKVFSLDPEFGSVNWMWMAPTSVKLSNIVAIDESTVVVATLPINDGVQAELIGLDRATGAQRWSSPIVDPYGPVRSLPSSGLLLHPGGAESNDLAALDLTTGEVVWQGGNDALGYLGTSRDSSPPVVVLGGDRPAVETIDPETGTPGWGIEGDVTILAGDGDALLVGFIGPMSLNPEAAPDAEGVLVSSSLSSGGVSWAAPFAFPPTAVEVTAGGILVWAQAPAVACD